MKRYKFTTRAEAQLEEITEYTLKRYGERRARAYAAQIAARIAKALEMPALMRPRAEYGIGVLAVRAQSHVAYGRFDGETFVVYALLHQSMDPARHLRFDTD